MARLRGGRQRRAGEEAGERPRVVTETDAHDRHCS